jgi:hypothetical protein
MYTVATFNRRIIDEALTIDFAVTQTVPLPVSPKHRPARAPSTVHPMNDCYCFMDFNFVSSRSDEGCKRATFSACTVQVIAVRLFHAVDNNVIKSCGLTFTGICLHAQVTIVSID